ncbi:MAG: histidine kinase [Paludibacteraceae bacterium]
MKSKINIILPIALSLILPGLNLFTNTENVDAVSFTFMAKWLYASLILYFIWHILFLTSKYKGKHRWLLTALTVVVSTSVVYLLFSLAIFKTSSNIKWIFIGKITSASVLFLLIQYAQRATDDIAQLKLEKEQMQTENYLAQLQELRLKVDPHFLFNSMNTLRTMLRNNHEQSEAFVMNLSNFYRQTLKLNNSSTVRLEEELDVLKSYLFLMQIRNEGNLTIDIDVNNEWKNFLIPTLTLQIVAENCFKHNQISSARPLTIKIQSADDFYIFVVNNYQPKIVKAESSGYGLSNIKKRYELMGIKNGLIVNQTDSVFEVKLKLI